MGEKQIKYIYIIIICVSLVILIFPLIDLYKYLISLSWEETTGTLLESSYKEHVNTEEDSNGRDITEYTYEILVDYKYKVGDRTYENDKYSLYGETSYNTAHEASEIIEELGNQDKVKVYYDKDDPKKSALSIKPEWLSMILTIIFPIVFFSLFHFVFFKKIWKHSKRSPFDPPPPPFNPSKYV